MAEDKLHQEFDMAFPLLGCYERDGVDAYDVELLLRHFFQDTVKIIDIHTQLLIISNAKLNIQTNNGLPWKRLL